MCRWNSLDLTAPKGGPKIPACSVWWLFFLNYIILMFKKKIRTEHQETLKMCLRPQRGAFSGVLHAYTVASKNRCFTTVLSV